MRQNCFRRRFANTDSPLSDVQHIAVAPNPKLHCSGKKTSRSVSNFVFRATQASSASLILEFRLGFFSSTTIHQPEIHIFRRDKKRWVLAHPSTIHHPSFLNQTRNKGYLRWFHHTKSQRDTFMDHQIQMLHVWNIYHVWNICPNKITQLCR